MPEMSWYFRGWWLLSGGAFAEKPRSRVSDLRFCSSCVPMLVESEEVADPPDSGRRTPRLGYRRRLVAQRLHDEVTGAAKFLALVVQLFLLAVLIYRFNLESPAFVQLIWMTFAGFVVHFFLPIAYRLPFFLALSLAAI